MAVTTWFITGINSGFGRILTEQVLGRGDRVFGTVRQKGSVDDLLAAHPDTLHVGLLDLTDAAGIEDVVGRAFTRLGAIDVIVNNAGYGLFGAAEEASDDQIVHIVDTNLLGSIRVARAALPRLRAQGGGRIIQLSTVGGQTAAPGASLYAMTKWGIEGFMDSLAGEVAPFGIGVTLVEPGGARTDFRTGGLQFGEPLAAYDGTPAAMVRGLRDADMKDPGDPSKIASIIIDSLGQSPAPRRIALGRSSYDAIHTALSGRLSNLESQKELAYSADFPEGE